MKILVSDELCRDCQACLLGCSLVHEGQCHPGLARLRVVKDMASYTFALRVCRHCEPPACREACPVGAIHSDGHGLAVLNEAECIGCGACAAACPYEALFYDQTADRYLKCDLCAGRREGPLCVALCPVGALTLAE